MVRQVFDNAMCAHVWAQQTQESGRTNNGNMFFNGPTLYSYGHHFPLGHFTTFRGKEIVLLNNDSYSVSTGKHQTYAIRALGYSRENIVRVTTDIIKAVSRDTGITKDTAKQILARLKEKSDRALLRASRARLDHSRAYAIAESNDVKKQARFMCDYFKLYKPKWTQESHVDDKALAALIAKEKARKESMRAEIKKKRKEWRNGEISYCQHALPVMLRVSSNGAEIETSQNARFPIEHATKAWPYIKACKNAGKQWDRNGQQIRLGHFQIDRIESNGNVKAGCHYVPFSEIETIASLLGLDI